MNSSQRNFSSSDESSTDEDKCRKPTSGHGEDETTKRMIGINNKRSTSSSSSYSSGTISTLTPSPPPSTSHSAAMTNKTSKNIMDDNKLKAQMEEQQKPTETTTGSTTNKEEAKAEGGASSGSSTESTEEKEDIFDVEDIVGHKKVKGQDLWRVRWFGYGPDADTWEPIENLLGENVRAMIANYQAKEEAEREQRKEMARRSDEYKKQKMEGKEASNSSSNEEEADDLNESNVSGWFGIKPGQGTREQQRLFVPDRKLDETEKLLSEISTPGNRVLRNHLRTQSNKEKSFSPVASGSRGTRKRGRPKKPTLLTATSVSDVFTSEGGASPSQSKVRTPDKSAKKKPPVKKPKIAHELLAQPKPKAGFAEAEQPGLKTEAEKIEKKAKEAENEPKTSAIAPIERSASASSSVAKDKAFGISKKLALAKRAKKEHKQPKEEKVTTDETAPTTSKPVEKKRPKQHTSSVDLSLKELPKGTDIGADLEKVLLMKRQEMQSETKEISQQELEENVLDGKVEKVRQILALNAQKPFLDLDHCDDTGKTLIHRLCEIKCGVSHTQCELIHLLATNGARLNVPETNNGQIPLHLAIAHRRTCHMLKLLELQSPVNSPDRNGKPPIMLALDCSDNVFMRSLLKHGASFHLAMEKVYRDRDRFRRPMRILCEHETRLRRALNSARDNVTMNMTVKCISPIFVNPMHEEEAVQTFQLSTQPQLPTPNSAYMIFCGVAEFTQDNDDLDSASNIEARARMWGRSPVLSASMNGKECAPLKPDTNSNFAFLCVPQRDQNQVKLRLDPEWRDGEMVLLSQMVLCTFLQQGSSTPSQPAAALNNGAKPVAPVHPLPAGRK